MNKEQTNTGLVTVAVSGNPHQIPMIKSFLEEEGIEVFLQDELLNQLYLSAVGGIRIQVSGADAETARSLLVEGGFADYVF